LFVLTACGAGAGAALPGVTLSGDTLYAGTRWATTPLELRYTLGRPAAVTIAVQPAQGGSPVLLRNTTSGAGSYYLRVDGTVPLSDVVPGPTPIQVSRVLTDGSYTLSLQAAPTDGTPAASWSGTFKMVGAPPAPPVLENVQVHPDTISPNGDALDDVASLTFRTAPTTTTSVTVLTPDGQHVPLLAPTPLPAGEHNIPFSGNDLFGSVLPDGLYTASVRTADNAGNTIEARLPITISGSGTPSIALLSADFTPHAIIMGNAITVRMRVQNTGKVPLRTQGPDSGFTYTTNDTYSSIAGGQYTDKAGLWRVGVDWTGNTGGAPYRYPFRWGFGHTLQPGEIVTIEGHITLLKNERQMLFYTGVLQEGVRIVLDQLAPTTIDVSF
jgi:hypothetical protein